MIDMGRKCARPQCGENAVATMSYAYAKCAVLIEDLHVESHPMTHDLCKLHAESIRVPKGWTLTDDRESQRVGESAFERFAG